MSVNNLGTFLNIKDSHLRVVSGNVYAQGINIGGITVDAAHSLQSITNQGNVTTTTLQFDNATTAFTTTANVTVGRDLTVTGNALVSSNLTVTGNATVSSNLTVTGNVVISDDLTVTENLLVSNNLTVTGNTFYTNPAAVLVDSNVVTEYTGPHDRPLRKYPEVAMTSASQGGYVVTPSTQNSNNPAYHMFDGDRSTRWLAQGSTDSYDSSSLYLYNGSNSSSISDISGTQHNGAFLKLELPTAIKLDYTIIRENSDPASRTPGKITFLGSTNGTDWTFLKEFSGMSNTALDETYVINETNYYNHFAFVVKNLSDGDGGLDLGEWELYGHEEGSGSLDTTLKSVYNVPATTGTQLEVYYDAKDLTAMPVTVTDLAGGNQNGTPGTGVSFDSTYKAFVFDGTANGKIVGTHGLSGTAPVNTCSAWFKKVSSTGNYSYISRFGANAASSQIAISIDERSSTLNKLRFEIYGASTALESELTITENVWYHVAGVYSGGTWNTNNCKLYLNGVEISLTNGTNTTTTPSITDTTLVLGSDGNSNSWDLDGSIANFRLYSKALNADQVKELYDYQKDYFLGSKSQVTLYKGHLGVGVTEPSGQLELAGDERIQEYPPGPLSNYETLIPGHGVFTASESNVYLDGFAPSWMAFDDSITNFWHSHTTYNANTGVYEGSQGMGGFAGEWIGLKMPYKTQITTISLQPRLLWPERTLHEGVLLGENNSEDWEVVKQFSGVIFSSGTEVKYLNVDSNNYYSNYVLVITKTYAIPGTTNGRSDSVQFSNVRLFGTPGPTTLDKGSLSLTRSLDVPRVSRYDVDTETPRPEKLVVDFDTTVNSSPTDISGKGNHGTFYNGASYSAADKAFNTPNSTGILVRGSTLGSGAQPLTLCAWAKGLGDWNATANDTIIGIGPNSSSGYSSFQLCVNTDAITLDMASASNFVEYPVTITNHRWYFIAMTYSGGDAFTNTRVYLDGVEIAKPASWTNGSSDTLNLPSNPDIGIGTRTGNGSGTTPAGYLAGMVSNPKVYNVALEPSEVQKLYRLGRTGRSMVISDTAVGIGKVPEAQLDVRGNLNVSSFIKYDSAWFYAYDGDTSGTGDFSDYTGYVPWAYLMSGSKHFTTASASTSGGYYTAPVDGIYHFDTSVLNYPDARTGITGMHFSVNDRTDGTNYSSGYNRKTDMPGQENMSASLTTKLNMGDTVKVYVANIDCYTQSNHAFFSGYLITRI